jgi:hypothetical protein
MGIQPRSAASLALEELGVMMDSAMGGCGCCRRPRDIAHLELGPHAVLERELPEAPVDLVGRVLGPELEHDVDGLLHHQGPQLGLPHLEHLEVADQPARPDAHDEAAARRAGRTWRVRGHRGGMGLGQVEHAGAEPDLPGPRDDGGEEDERRGDALAPGAEVLADIGLGEPELIGQDHRLLILGED